MTKIESAKKRIHISGSIVQPIAKERSVVYESKRFYDECRKKKRRKNYSDEWTKEGEIDYENKTHPDCARSLHSAVDYHWLRRKQPCAKRCRVC